jgi:uncharacterized protein YjbJ (UPF0337 family)
MMNLLSVWLKNVMVYVGLIALLFSSIFGFGQELQAQAEPLTPEATMYQVNSPDSPFRKNEQEKANQLFQENKRPVTTPPKLTQEIGNNINKSASNIKQTIEGVADNVKDKAASAYEEQRNKPKTDIKDIAENIKDKLNLDQPLYPGTKEFIEDVKEKVQKPFQG